LLAKIEGGATNYYHSDLLSVRLMTDANGVTIGQQGHFPYGEPLYDTMPANEWKFTSYQRDPESSNDYALARYYTYRIGRFTSSDIQGGSLGGPQTLNRYSYVTNDPVNLSDPSGQYPVPFQRWFISAMTVAQMTAGNCTMDGIDTGCAMLQTFSNATINCPHNDCSVFQHSYKNMGADLSLVPGVNGPVWINNKNGEEISDAAAAEVGFGVPGDSSGPAGPPDDPRQSPVVEETCKARVLDAVNSTFGTNFTADNVKKGFFWSGAWNFNISSNDLSASAFNAISQQGRYALDSSFAGTGPTLHVPSSNFWDPQHTFISSNIGGQLSVLFTAHIDSSNGNFFPTGTFAHFVRDVIGHKHRSPCP
jgi:RHS repeat-associated protein